MFGGKHGACGCAKQARQRTVQQAGPRYQAGHRGRRMHAARMGRWLRPHALDTYDRLKDVGDE